MSQGNELLKHSENQINKNNPNSSRFICFCIAYYEILELRRPNSRSWNNSLMCLFYRESFPNDLQFSILMRFTVDQTQTPSLKVRIFWLSVQKEIFIDRHLLVLIIEFRLLVSKPGFQLVDFVFVNFQTVKPALQDQLRSFWSSKVFVWIIVFILNPMSNSYSVSNNFYLNASVCCY